MSRNSSFSYRRGVPLNPTHHPHAVEYFERAQEVSNQFSRLEDRISQLEKECSCFREEIEAGRRMIKLEKQKIENKKRNLTMHAKTPKRDRKSGHMFSRSYFDRNNEKCHSFDDQYYLNFRRMNDFHEFDDYDHYYESNKNRQNEKNRDLFNFERNTKNRFDYSENEFNRNNYGDNDIDDLENSNQMNKNIKHNQNNSNNYFYDDNNSDYSSFRQNKSFYNSFSSNQFSKDEEASSAFYEKYVQEEIEYTAEIKKIREQLNELELRRVDAEKILATKVDEISETEEIFEYEFLPQNEDNFISCQNLDKAQENLNELLSDVEFIESQNQKRNYELNLKRKRLTEMKKVLIRNQNYKNKKMINTNQNKNDDSSENQSSYNNNLLKGDFNGQSPKAGIQKIDTVYQKLKERNLEIQKQEEQTDSFIEKTTIQRQNMENEYRNKVERIEHLKQDSKLAQLLCHDIEKKENEINKLLMDLNQLQEKKSQMEQKISESRQKEIEQKYLTDHVMKKQNLISAKENEISIKKRNLEKRRESIRKMEIDSQLFNERVQHIESQVDKIMRLTNDKLDCYQQESLEMTKSLQSMNKFQKEKSIEQMSDNSTEIFDVNSTLF